MFNISFNGREIEYEKNINIVNCSQHDTDASQIHIFLQHSIAIVQSAEKNKSTQSSFYILEMINKKKSCPPDRQQ